MMLKLWLSVGLVGAGCTCAVDKAGGEALNAPSPGMPEAQHAAWPRPLHFEPAPNDTVNSAAAVSPALSSACAASSDDPVTDAEESQERAEVIAGQRAIDQASARLRASIEACGPAVDALFKAGRAVDKPALGAAHELSAGAIRTASFAAVEIRRLSADVARRDEAVERCLDLLAVARDAIALGEAQFAPTLMLAPSIANVCAAATQGASPAARARAAAGFAALEAGVPETPWLSDSSLPHALSKRLIVRLRTLLSFLRAGLAARRFHDANGRWPAATELGEDAPRDARASATTSVEVVGEDWVARGRAGAPDDVTLTVTPDGRRTRLGAP